MRSLVWILAVAACGGPDELTCDLLADEGNCWATAAEAMAACMPARATAATFAADRASCTFSDGVRVVFDEPLAMSTIELDRLAFSVEDGSGECARFVDTFENRMELTGGGQTVAAQLRAGTFTLQCPDGDFESPFDTLFDCAAIGAPPPTDGFDVTPTSFEFSLSAVTTPGQLFRCE
jgi:hypothetical protein